MLSTVRSRGTRAIPGTHSLWNVLVRDDGVEDGSASGGMMGKSFGDKRRAYSAQARVASAYAGGFDICGKLGFVRSPSLLPFAASAHGVGRRRAPGAMTSQTRNLFGFGRKKGGEAVAEMTTAGGAAETLTSASDLAPVVGSLASEVVPVASQSWPTTAALMYAMEYFHVAHGLEWWLAIVGATVFMRTITFPLIVMQMRNTAKMQLCKPELEALQAKMKSNPQQDPELANAYYKEMQKVWKKYDVNPVKSFAPILINAPVFISFFFAISKMAQGVPSFESGGPSMYPDLSMADPTYSLPILSSLTFLASVELGAVEGMQTSQSAQMKWFLRALAVAMVPLTASFPQGVFVYWITSNIFSGFQTSITRTKAFKSTMGIPDVSAVAEAPAEAALGRVQLDRFQKKYGATPTLHKRPPTQKQRKK